MIFRLIFGLLLVLCSLRQTTSFIFAENYNGNDYSFGESGDFFDTETEAEIDNALSTSAPVTGSATGMDMKVTVTRGGSLSSTSTSVLMTNQTDSKYTEVRRPSTHMTLYSQGDIHYQAYKLQNHLENCSNCLGHCSDGRCCINADPITAGLVQDASVLLRDAYTVLQNACTKCPKNGGWSEWSKWTTCHVTCGKGTRTRSRVCDNPLPEYRGQICRGANFERVDCLLPPCCEPVAGNWSPWETWSQCSVSCGDGSKSRVRRCSNPPPNACGQPCYGHDNEVETCHEQRACCAQGLDQWGSWSEWGHCSSTCGWALKSRKRVCDRQVNTICPHNCYGADSQFLPCMDRSCCRGRSWSSWGGWSECGERGLRERVRSCDRSTANECENQCSGQSRETEHCETCRDGAWGHWASWSSCNSQKIQERRRLCDNPSRNYCGADCIGANLEEQVCQDCLGVQWDSWGSWSTCSSQGHRERSRTCLNPNPAICINTCIGIKHESERCTACRDGAWGSWGLWSSCTFRGVIQRTRSCNNPTANYCGIHCQGSSVEEKICPECYVCSSVLLHWGAWGSWSSCLAQGHRERSRSCINPAPDVCTDTCPGRNYESESCQFCQDGQWTSWGQWSDCSVTCGLGVQNRIRQCSNPPRNSCGRVCPGSAFDQRQCTVPTFRPPGCSWGEWSSWSSCPDPCLVNAADEGSMRYRVCQHPDTTECQNGCTGNTMQARSCPIAMCMEHMSSNQTNSGYEGDSMYADGSDTSNQIPTTDSIQTDTNSNGVLGSETDDDFEILTSMSTRKDKIEKHRRRQHRRKKDPSFTGEEDRTVVEAAPAEGDVTASKEMLPGAPSAVSQTGLKREQQMEERRNESDRFVCHSTCKGLDKGKMYQSCHGCHFYLHCPFKGEGHIKSCPKKLKWDAIINRCSFNSHTCQAAAAE